MTDRSQAGLGINREVTALRSVNQQQEPELLGLTIGSLFSGIGGLELGLERGIGDGCRTVWQVEQDEYCRAVLAKHWPNAKRYEDVRNVGRETLESVDIICGGFPCQDISSAGKRAGIRGERSGLWSEYARIIRELRPQYVVVENVSRLLADGMGVVLGELAACGYDAEWDCIPASAVGAPHQRDRVFIVAYPAVGKHEKGLHLSVRPRRQNEAQVNAPRCCEAMAHSQTTLRWRAGGAQDEGRRNPKARGRCVSRTGLQHWATEPDVGRVANGVPSRLDKLGALGNAVVPQVSEVVGRLIAEREKELRGAA